MQYRKFGSLDWDVSALGFGTMRLPLRGSREAEIDEPQAIKLIQYGIDQGINYVDTAYPYHDGYSEVVVGKALEGQYREKVRLATKMPVFSVNTKQELDDVFELQLKRLRTNYVDFYLLHALMASNWKKVEDLNMFDWAERQIRKGKIGYLGFSFHDDLNLFKEIIDAYDWSFCQIQFNYLDEFYQAGVEGLKYAASKGLAVVIMEPLAGGLLAVNPPAEIQQEWDKSGVKRLPTDWALQWVWNHPEVSTALSGMNAMDQLIKNIESANNSGSNILTPKEVQALTNSRLLFEKYGYIGCSKCHYCKNCPQGLEIPAILELLNEYTAKRHDPAAQNKIKQRYLTELSTEQRANNCIQCGQCEKTCPQHLPVTKLIHEAAASL